MPVSVVTIKPGSWAAWKIAFRPKTLWVATVPVVVAAALVFSAGRAIHLPSLVLAMLCAVMIQIITNLQNDVGYTARGHETGERIGFPRATQTGLLTARHIRIALLFCALVTILLGLPLVIWHGLPILIIGIASMIAAVLYMAGFRPIAYTALGELFVFIFFGLVAVNGTVYLFTHQTSAAAWLLSVIIGLLAAAVLLVNNYRDAEHDRNTGRRTLVVVLGKRHTRRLYAAMVFLPFILLLPLTAISPLLLLPMLALPLAIQTYRALGTTSSGSMFNTIMLRTVQLEALFGLLFCIGSIAVGIIK
ncbi:MAG: 1,4-dihydroxy-2-naphthoate octaprenyltransferase [Burkholderiales bacterium]|jgi:1,4-dihydroxy-2-naphthoate octaprenyltransferase|nr:1,4-dihydroxy-2-naphthoate octaprenyltransferase [Burkholderiales bacterium]